MKVAQIRKQKKNQIWATFDCSPNVADVLFELIHVSTPGSCFLRRPLQASKVGFFLIQEI